MSSHSFNHHPKTAASLVKRSSYLLTLALVLSTGAGYAQGKSDVEASYLDRDTAYIFQDDPLNGESQGPNSERIRVRPRGHRSTLLRPRVHFVQEIFKSAENF